MNRVLVTRNPMGRGYAAFEMRGNRVFAVNVARTPQMLADLQYSAAYPVGTVFRWILPARSKKAEGGRK